MRACYHLFLRECLAVPTLARGACLLAIVVAVACGLPQTDALAPVPSGQDSREQHSRSSRSQTDATLTLQFLSGTARAVSPLPRSSLARMDVWRRLTLCRLPMLQSAKKCRTCC